jgi:cyclohexadienyl dehydratase
MKNLLRIVPLALALVTAAPALADAPASRLDAVIKSGVLRVGTTGDYKPFTYLDPETKKFEGIDIDMARSLGKALGVEVKFVQTSWPKLMSDFGADKFDIAVGGISVNLQRQKQALFSLPYLVDGKTPIARCADKGKYETIAEIDRPEVRVIENPGGTNEKFARAHLKKAAITIYKDNVTIFDQIAKGKADVMITDAIETVLQHKLHPTLCAVHPEKPFNFSEKAYLLPRDSIFKDYVDQWLHQALMKKEFQAVYDKWVK